MSENSTVHQEAFWLLAGRQLHQGMSRQVYTSPVLPDCVVKVEDSSGEFQNVIEWETWNRVKDTPHARWFAPCKWISPKGVVLIMARTTEPTAKQYPARMPMFLTDFKRTNYGIHEGRLVCHDYGTNELMKYGRTFETQKVDWWNEP